MDSSDGKLLTKLAPPTDAARRCVLPGESSVVVAAAVAILYSDCQHSRGVGDGGVAVGTSVVAAAAAAATLASDVDVGAVHGGVAATAVVLVVHGGGMHCSSVVHIVVVVVAVAVVVAAAANSNIVVDGSTGYCTHHSKRPKAEHQGLVLKHLIWAMRMEACCTWFSSFSACEDLAKL
jgi:hypothetical protein